MTKIQKNIASSKSPCRKCKAEARCSNACDKFRMWFCGEWNRLRRMYGMNSRGKGEEKQ